MKPKKTKKVVAGRAELQPINWEEVELQVYSLKSPRMTPEEKLEKAKQLAEVYRKAGKPLPDILAILA